MVADPVYTSYTTLTILPIPAWRGDDTWRQYRLTATQKERALRSLATGWIESDVEIDRAAYFLASQAYSQPFVAVIPDRQWGQVILDYVTAPGLMVSPADYALLRDELGRALRASGHPRASVLIPTPDQVIGCEPEDCLSLYFEGRRLERQWARNLARVCALVAGRSMAARGERGASDGGHES